MNRTNSFTLASGLLTILILSYGASRTEQTASPSGPVLTVPAGFTIERVAGPPLVDRPIVADFDEEGRLYVADSSGSNDKTDKQVIDRPHRIVRLEDTDGDGRFDKSIVFADKMMLPEGTMWLAGSLYVAAPPSIWKLTDTNGDGVADQREEWWQGKTLTGCANDLHGPYLGPDGWIYWTKGAFAEQTYERAGKPPFVTKASHILRRRPGDPAVDVVMTGGMDNPVDVAFTSSGESFLTSTFVEQPQLGRRDGFLHAIYGGLYGKVHAVIDGHKRTGDLMPILCQLGPAVPAGLTNYSSPAFGDGFRDNFFAAMFNLRKVSRYALEPSGATFTVHDTDFVVSENRDSHPTDVIEDADGSLLVVDTGAWYKLCCPTSQLAKPDILGGIYRVRRTGAAAIRDPRGRSLPWNTMSAADLTALLADERPAVQSRAVRTLGIHGPAAVTTLVTTLKQSASADARRNAVWALTRMDAASAREAVRLALNDRDDGVRHAAIHSSGLWRDAGALTQLREGLTTGTASIRRVAAESLGRIGDARAVPELIALAGSPLDRVLEHSVTYALIEINNPAATQTGLQSNASRARRAALIALDQMDSGHLQPEQITSLLDSPDVVLKDTAWWIAGHHPEWGAALAGYFATRLAQPGIGATERTDLEQKLTLFGDTSAVQELLASNLERARSKADQLSVLGTMATIARTRVKTLPSAWMDPLARTISTGDAELASAAVSVVRAVPAAKDAAPGFQASLLRVGHDASRPIEIRLGALAALPNGLASVDPEIFGLLRTGIEPSQTMPVRATAAAIVEKAAFDRSQLGTLATSLETVGPLELPRLLRSFGNATDEATGLAMIAALNKSAVRGSVRPDVLRPLLAKYPESVQKAGEALLASVTQDAVNQLKRLEQLLPTIQGGDIVRGQAVFNSPKVACTSCHAIGYIGGRIGPDLTRIGQVRSERDLLEAIAYPSASFARGFEPVVVRTRSGQVHTGVLRNNDLPDEIVLATERDEIRIPRRDIVDMQPGTVSLMPPGLIDQLTRQELADLLAFLKATRSGA